MSDVNTHLERLKRIAAAPPPGEPADGDDEFTAFAAGRVGAKPLLTLVLRRVTGTCHAFAYAHLYQLDYDPSAGIALHFSRHRVALTGRHLGGLFRYLCDHRVQTVQEVDSLHAETLPPDAPVVTGVEMLAVRDAGA